jgi:hypothetical protein
VQVGSHFPSDNSRHRRLAESGRPCKEEVVGGLATPPRSLKHDRKVSLKFALPHEFRQRLWPETGVLALVRLAQGVDKLLTHGVPLTE